MCFSLRSRANQVLGQILKSLKAMHDGGYAHRNLKPSNVLRRGSHNDWVLADFACAAVLSALPLALSSSPPVAVSAARCLWLSSESTTELVLSSWT
jgi:serine/threonine protein kinase